MAEMTALTPVKPTQSSVLAAAVNVDRLVEPEIVAESRRCIRIFNKISGLEYLRKLDENAHWETLYKYAKKNPNVFDCEMETADAAPLNEEGPLLNKDGVVIYTEAELLERNIMQLRELGKAYGLTGRQKSQLIVDIMKAQRKG